MGAGYEGLHFVDAGLPSSRLERAFVALLGTVAALALAVSLVYAGFVACTVPAVTQALSRATCQAEASPYTVDELADLALAGRDYAFGPHDREALLHAEAAAIASAQADGRALEGDASSLVLEELSSASPGRLEAALSSRADRWVLTEDALAHLDDCHKVADMGHRVCLTCLAVAAFACTACGLIGGKRALGTVILAGGAATLTLLASLAVWALTGFSAMFETLHGLVFTQGTWRFPWDSLLICMYPQGFWAGMGCVWVVTSVACAIVAVTVGMLARRRA